MLLERLIVNRPHPWGLLITFIELIKNPRCAPPLVRHPSVSCRRPRPARTNNRRAQRHACMTWRSCHQARNARPPSSFCHKQVQLLDARVHALRAGDRPPVRVGRAQLHGPGRAAQARGGRSAARARARARAVDFGILIVAAPCSTHWSLCARRALRLGGGYRAADADEPAPSSGLWVWACRLQQGDSSLADACVRPE